MKSYFDKVVRDFNKAKSRPGLDADDVFQVHIGIAAYTVASSCTPPYGSMDLDKAREQAHERLDQAIDDYRAHLVAGQSMLQ